MTIASVTITPAATKTTAGAAPNGTGDTAGDLFSMLVAAFVPAALAGCG